MHSCAHFPAQLQQMPVRISPAQRAAHNARPGQETACLHAGWMLSVRLCIQSKSAPLIHLILTACLLSFSLEVCCPACHSASCSPDVHAVNHIQTWSLPLACIWASGVP
eukprot:692540-Pelagomonas_calceolata.AAC.2